MAEALRWTSQDTTLALSGDLDRDSLLPFWQQRETLLAGKHTLDISALDRVDSAGLALLVHLYQQQNSSASSLVISGAGERVKTLIALYNLNDVIPVV
ncbi:MULTISPECIES: lipid asymmetry maintenance protein MlaB [unclassified Symbiopectobacterium]|uniref:lipid asymmetry maintenance protein MlaB n=1 Tax=unclassified Symbiopectobacterium TaxID=2794573 RepID=UPI002225F147|nr:MULTISPECIES: lipid asymmetry maintenance protein MlaB [unclassified Symbiopectobacterium]MCW2475524.1 lipid asymmetry maintenance protein MlaB [Candidatus Symbiopectobacterium sp. NZEC151]MCW2486293.1 lipid asymmetry maintenance protein MlaB [Candidatus Symbiopectobacterium sp. NZEC127]